ncbi:hypothetical protein [Klebsiella oxytoca]|uniref:hypothetical protein n=1 Tax=Klebsiella oxytoca TaxID=571 RepID=UPI0015E9EFB3|nr:hypothetical protein [Klebsiella oxytoca]QMF99457.1 hypothetical protein HVY70_21000 [Klebsiella oxytoca]
MQKNYRLPGWRRLQDYLRQLVSELSVVEGIHNDAVFITDELYDASPKEVQNIIGSLACMKMPAYARLVARIKADAEQAALNDLLRHLDGIDIGNLPPQWTLYSEVVKFVNSRLLREGAK